jgi:hypothetical protein
VRNRNKQQQQKCQVICKTKTLQHLYS